MPTSRGPSASSSAARFTSPVTCLACRKASSPRPTRAGWLGRQDPTLSATCNAGNSPRCRSASIWAAEFATSRNMSAHFEDVRAPPDLRRALARPNHEIERNPSDSDAYVERGAVYETAGDWERALLDYGRAIEIDPANIEARFSRGYARLMLSDWEAAAADFSTVSAAEPERHHVIYLRAHCYDSWAKPDFAIADFTKVLQMVPEHVHALLGRASV